MNFKSLCKIVDSEVETINGVRVKDAKSKDFTSAEVRNLMLQDLKKKLDSGEILYFSGADRPGENVTYCNRDKLEEVLHKLKKDYEFEGETIDELCEEVGVDPLDKYFRIAKDWNDNGGFYSSSGNTVEDLDPAMDNCVELLKRALNQGIITKDQVVFSDDNDDVPFADEDFIDDIPEDMWYNLS